MASFYYVNTISLQVIIFPDPDQRGDCRRFAAKYVVMKCKSSNTCHFIDQ
jgi:hypothetical protein